MYYLGIGRILEIDIEKAEHWYRRAAELATQTDRDILYGLAFPLEAMGRKDRAIALYRESARKGNKKSQDRLKKLGLG